MKTKIILLIMSCICASNLCGQYHTLTGTVKDKQSQQNIEYATVALLAADSSIVAASSTKNDGSYKLENILSGSYVLNVSFVGYESYREELKLNASKNMEIFLAENETMLKEAVVQGKRSFIQQKIDKYVVNISDHILTAGKSGMDLLKFTPGLLVHNRNVTIMGENVDVWIDGRPSRMSGATLAAYLEGLRGDDVDQIEVITNPSSKHDAGGGRGIINIITKKNRNMNVLNGSVNAGYELSKKHKGIGGVGLNYRIEKMNIYGSYNIRGGNDISTLDEKRTNLAGVEPRTFDKSTEYDVYRTISNNYRAGIDFFPNKSNIIGFLFTGFYNTDEANPYSRTFISPALNNTATSFMDGKYENDIQGQMYNANYKHIFNKPGVELDINADYGDIKNSQEQVQNYTFLSNSGVESEPSYSERNNLPQTTKMWSLKADYQHPISESLILATGIKAGNTKTDNDIKYEELVNNIWTNDIGRSNHFIYKEDIYAAYVMGGGYIKKFAYELGLRAEYTVLKGEQRTTSETNKNDYFKLFPTVHVMYSFNDNNTLILSYTRRIRRPGFQTLNPFEIVLDNYSYIVGNPNLKPSYNNNFEFKYSFKQKFTATLNVTHNEQMILQEPVVEPNDNRYGYVFTNFGNRTAYIFMLTYNNTFFKIWRLNFMGQVAYIKNKADKVTSNFDNDGVSGAVWLSNNFQINKTLSIETGLLLTPAMRIGYDKSDKLDHNLSLGIRKSILKNKASISISANDVLNGQISKNTTRVNDLYIKRRDDNNQRYVMFNFSYRFGSDKVKKARSRSTGIEDELERTNNPAK